MAVVFSGLACHAPIVVPDVGGAETARCRATTAAMGEVARRAVASRPDRLVLVSPHAPRLPDCWAAWPGRVRGDLAAFGAPGAAVDLPGDPAAVAALRLPAARGRALDHGAVVPLVFLVRAGWAGPTTVVALPWVEGRPTAEELGEAVAALPGRVAVVASGDMSHRLRPGAPAGFHPEAHRFDTAFVEALRAGRWAELSRLPFREEAEEDVVDSTRVAVAAAGFPPAAEVIAYEGPWGVGYCEAVFREDA